MAGHRPRTEIAQCDATTERGGLQCRAILSRGWTRCPHHTWLSAEQFASELANGADIPAHPSRHELLGIGIYVSEGLTDGRIAIVETDA